jgi:Cysteine rich repeat
MSLRLSSFARVALASIAFVATITQLTAAEPERGAMAACGPDLAKLCPSVEAGGGKKMRCLADNRSSLSSGCSEAMNARLARRGAVLAQAQTPTVLPAPTASGQPPGTIPPPAVVPSAAPPAATMPKPAPLAANMRACRTDMATFCGSVEKGGGRRIKCLMDNQAKLGPDCAAAITSAQSLKQTAKASCVGDIAKLCPTARGPARRQCLEANKAQLSPDCAGTLDARAAKQ